MQKGVRCVRGLISHDECRKCALQALHPCELPADILEQMREDPDHRHADPESFSPSYLLDCDRKAALSVEGDWYVDVVDAWPSMRGNMVHALMQQTGDYPGAVGTIREMTFQTEVATAYGPKQFFGQPDLIVVLSDDDEVIRVKIVDYKSKSEIGHDLTAPVREHVMQINMYAWLVARELPKHLKKPARVEVVELEIVYADMKKVRRFTSAGPLQTRGKMIQRSPRKYATLDLEPVPMLDHAVVERWVTTHIEGKMRAMHVELPPILQGDAAWRCQHCPIREWCYEIGDGEVGDEQRAG